LLRPPMGGLAMTFSCFVPSDLSLEDPTLHQRVSITGTNLAPGPEIEGSVRWEHRQGRIFLSDSVTRPLCVRFDFGSSLWYFSAFWIPPVRRIQERDSYKREYTLPQPEVHNREKWP
jgi:hypothetical protein